MRIVSMLDVKTDDGIFKGHFFTDSASFPHDPLEKICLNTSTILEITFCVPKTLTRHAHTFNDKTTAAIN